MHKTRFSETRRSSSALCLLCAKIKLLGTEVAAHVNLHFNQTHLQSFQ